MTKYDSTIPTIRMCRFISTFEPPCHGAYRWLLESDGKTFVVCDTHLAAGIRASGLPAYIEEQSVTSGTIHVQTITEKP